MLLLYSCPIYALARQSHWDWLAFYAQDSPSRSRARMTTFVCINVLWALVAISYHIPRIWICSLSLRATLQTAPSGFRAQALSRNTHWQRHRSERRKLLRWSLVVYAFLSTRLSTLSIYSLADHSGGRQIRNQCYQWALNQSSHAHKLVWTLAWRV